MMTWACDSAVEVVFWGGVSSLLASLLSLFGLLNFWLVLLTAWSLSLGTCLYLSRLRLSTARKAVLITGCDTGIGNTLALHLHDLGFRVFAGCLLADTGGEGAQTLRHTGLKRLHVIQLDVTQQEQINNALLEVRRLLPEEEMLWGVINNAGVSAFGEVEWVPLNTYRRITEINVFGLIAVTKAFLPLIRGAQGRVVNMASVCGHIGRATMSPYVLSKFAVEGFSDCLRQEMAPWGVDVCIIEPCNYSAGTNITTEENAEIQGINMWQSMDEEVKRDYGQEYFDLVVKMAKLHSCSGLRDIRPIVKSVTEALIQKFPRARYRPITHYYFMKILAVSHLPEWIFERLYVTRRSLPSR